MSKLSEKLQLRRDALVTKSQAERMLLVLHGQELKQSLAFADMGIQITGSLARRPIIALAVLLTTFIIKPRRLVPLLKKALSVWQMWQLVAPSLNKIKRAAAPDHQE